MLQDGIIVHSYQMGENDGVVKILSQSGEIYSGFVKAGFSKKNNVRMQIGNLVSFSWLGRENSLGTIKLEIKKQYSAMLLANKIAFLGIVSLCSIIHIIIPKNSHNDATLYIATLNFLELCLVSKNDTEIVNQYLICEALILSKTGYYEQDKQITNLAFIQKTLAFYNKKIPQERLLFERFVK